MRYISYYSIKVIQLRFILKINIIASLTNQFQIIKYQVKNDKWTPSINYVYCVTLNMSAHNIYFNESKVTEKSE